MTTTSGISDQFVTADTMAKRAVAEAVAINFGDTSIWPMRLVTVVQSTQVIVCYAATGANCLANVDGQV